MGTGNFTDELKLDAVARITERSYSLSRLRFDLAQTITTVLAPLGSEGPCAVPHPRREAFHPKPTP